MIHNLNKAIVMATEAHDFQYDKCGDPYILHPLRVALNYGLTGNEQIVAVLHDVLEDTDITYDDLLRVFGIEIAEAVVSVSRLYNNPKCDLIFKPRPDATEETYRNFILRAGQNPIGRKVKIADLRDNLSPARLASLPEAEKSLAERYKMALSLLG